MVVSDEWSNYRDDDHKKATLVKEFFVNDLQWDKIDYIITFTTPIYDMLRICDTDKPCLHSVYDMWDTMIKNVKIAVYKHEGKQAHELPSSFYKVIYEILVSRWTKNNTHLHCLAHSLNLRYYGEIWLKEDPSQVPRYRDNEVSTMRVNCFKRYFSDEVEQERVFEAFVKFSSIAGGFSDSDSIRHQYTMDPKSWWYTYGASTPILQGLAFKLLVQPSSSSCAERNWSTYSFVHSIRRNKMTTKRVEDLVFIHSNLRLLSKRAPEYLQGENKLWDIVGDKLGTFQDVGELDIAELSLDELELESVVFTDAGAGGGEETMMEE